MPTARELLEQADALMRKNRGSDTDIPVLTDAVDATPSVLRAPSEIPVLTDRVEELVVDLKPLPDPPQAAERFLEGDPSDWLVMDTIDPAMHSVTGEAPDTLAVVPPVTLKAAEPTTNDVDVATPVTLKAAGSAPTPPPAGSGPPAPRSPLPAEISPPGTPSAAAVLDAEESLAVHPVPVVEEALAVHPVPVVEEALAVYPVPASASDDERWRVLAEQISMQVLQRIDLFTDTGLKEQLAHHLRPIVERAGAELVGAINEHVGELVRSYIAEAIEREIAQWRRDNP
jgi:hypothetical protein